jgi:hypothetical protein
LNQTIHHILRDVRTSDNSRDSNAVAGTVVCDIEIRLLSAGKRSVEDVGSGCAEEIDGGGECAVVCVGLGLFFLVGSLGLLFSGGWEGVGVGTTEDVAAEEGWAEGFG